jgi:hypothetical protein
MHVDQLPLASDLLTTMRVAVDYAREADAAYVSPHHILLALLDNRFVGPALNAALRRESLVAQSREPRFPNVNAIPESADAPADISPNTRYDTLAFRSQDGTASVWLDRTSYQVFLEGARRVEGGSFGPKHLALGFLSEAIKDPDLRALLGNDPAAVSATIYAL